MKIETPVWGINEIGMRKFMSEKEFFEYWKNVSLISAVFASVSMWITIYLTATHSYYYKNSAALFPFFFIASTFSSLGV